MSEKPGTPLALVTVAFGAVTTSYSVAISHEAPNSLTKLAMHNTFDRDVVISLDGGSTDHMFMSQGEARVLDNIRVPGSISIKSLVGSPSGGSFLIERFAAS